MEKVLAFFISGFLVSGLSGGGVTYKPTLNLLKRVRSMLAPIESIFLSWID
ncbi:hypothetical protein J5D27_03650 [Helicobacter pylori]|uniref:hypothetical protein n=1 Tax=Helicobacter pylori TaxID=210 RepID=UPI001AE157D0|nr:hypothetical protein [Helicobacter pylori]QTP01955.1 hypothetical protein J5D27_03650 [Helicobacter pylori]